MRSRAHRARLALILALGAGLCALGACGSNSAGDVRLRSASMTVPDDDQRLHYDSASAVRNSPP